MIELLLQAERAMSVGLVDRADILYTQIFEADPQNSIAVVGLARVALERGDEPGALELARRALAIDPENAAASRMVERLEEVLRYREGAVPARAETTTPATPTQDPSDASLVTPEPDFRPEPEPEPELTPATVVARPRWRSLIDRLLRRR